MTMHCARGGSTRPSAATHAIRPAASGMFPFASWEQVEAVAAELDPVSGPLVVTLAGTGLRAQEAFGAGWRDVDLARRVLRIRRAFADGRLVELPEAALARRVIPLRARVVAALERLPHRRGILFPAPTGGRMEVDGFCRREWWRALRAAGVGQRALRELRHTYATWSLAAGVDIATLARRMGLTVEQVERTYGGLVASADVYERALLDAFDAGPAERLGWLLDAEVARAH